MLGEKMEKFGSYPFRCLARFLFILCFTVPLMGQVKPNANPVQRGHKKSTIKYRDLSNTKAYDKSSLGQHISIKITPPKIMGADQFVFVEVYNYTQSDISYVEFDLTLSNKSGYDLSSKVDGNDMNKGWSALKKIAVPGKGAFPPVTKVLVDNLKVINSDATPMIVTAYVDLVRGTNKPVKKP